MATKPKKIKTAAAVYVCQSRDMAASDIKVIGDLSRQLARISAAMNDEIANVTEKYQQEIDDLKERMQTMQGGVQAWCEANRADLTNGGKVKTANLVTGNVLWRQRPPSVAIRGAETVIDNLKRMGFGRFVRTKDEINKEAILNEADAVRGIAGITVVTGVEDFVIEPFEQDLNPQ
jgi:phage host-nuclease inhibitor protein Gam